MVHLSSHQLAFIFGFLGNIVSVGVFLSPVPTFYRIYKKKTSEGFHAIPYICALGSASLLLLYGITKKNAYLLISINSFGCAIEIFYLCIYLIFAPREAKIFTLKLILLFNVGGLVLLMLVTDLLVPKSKREMTVGWVCAAYTIAVFAAPLSTMRKVIRTKSVEYMPYLLSLCLTLNAVMWFFYGVLTKDMFVASPNILGFLCGIAQMLLYVIYKDAKKTETAKPISREIGGTKEMELNSIEIVAVNPTDVKSNGDEGSKKKTKEHTAGEAKNDGGCRQEAEV